MTTLKQRHQIYLADDLTAALESLGAKSGSSKSAVVAKALSVWLDSRAGNALDDRFGLRFERIGRAQEAMGTRLDFLIEAFGIFVQHQLTMTAHQPALPPDAARLGQERFQNFIEAVGRKLARAERTGIPGDFGPQPIDRSVAQPHEPKPRPPRRSTEDSA